MEPVPVQQPSRNWKKITLLGVVITSLIIGIVLLGISYSKNNNSKKASQQNLPSNLALKTFNSSQEFKDYLQQAKIQDSFASTAIAPKALAAPAEGTVAQSVAQDATANRVSQTNVQVAGIDEPDIVKTNGQDIYYSSDTQIFYPLLDKGGPVPLNESVSSSSSAGSPVASGSADVAILPGFSPLRPLPQPVAQTKVISATPAASLAVKSQIDKQGDLLLNNQTLVVFSNSEINGFDVSQESSPSAKWNITLDNNNQIVTSRLLNGKIYLISRSDVNYGSPCPLQPISSNGAKIAIGCAQIYHPINPTSVDSTYTVSIINPDDGKIENNISFVGSQNQSAVYMSANNLHVSYLFNTDTTSFMYNFLTTDAKNLIGQSFEDRLVKLQSYDISQQAKQIEQNVILDQFRATLSTDDQVKFDNELQNRLSAYTKVHLRDLEKTGIARIGLKDFKVDATGLIAGQLLNQYSMDEYQNNLRVATTVNGNIVGVQQSANDVLVLDKDLKTIGNLSDLGQGESIYSVRFIDDKGYLVTFKQTDPFFVLDLSHPNSPQVKGQLKIPGYSSYLDALEPNKILGVGQENGKVKLSLFDVTDPGSPVELDNYNMNEYYTDVSNNPHAFLKDPDNKIFFIPGGQGGYIFSYDNDKFILKKAISGFQIKRAIYINNFLYILGDQKIVVLNEKDWSIVGQLPL